MEKLFIPLALAGLILSCGEKTEERRKVLNEPSLKRSES